MVCTRQLLILLSVVSCKTINFDTVDITNTCSTSTICTSDIYRRMKLAINIKIRESIDMYNMVPGILLYLVVGSEYLVVLYV